MGTRDCDLFSYDLEVDVPNVARPVNADADTWHRHMGHINGRSSELLNRTDDNGVSFKGVVSSCDVYAIGKNTQHAHPKTAMLNIE